MTTAAPSSANKFFEDVFQNIRKAAETSLKLQQEVISQWSSLLPVPNTQSALVEKVQGIGKRWSETVSELAHKHRATVEKQFDAALESLDAALKVGEATTVEEWRRRSELLCRKTIDCLREVSETQITEIQDAISKWTDLATKAGKQVAAK